MILYLVLFIPGALSGGLAAPVIEFSILGEMSRLLLYTIPAFALVWKLLLHTQSLREWDTARPKLRDLQGFLIAFPGLLVIGLIISLLSPLIFKDSPIPKMEAPPALFGWIVLVLSSLGTGYLEESYFRFYLLNMLERAGLSTKQRLFISVMFFSFCHIYEGPGGAINALLAGLLLSGVFIRKKSLHGLAWAHGLYNVLAYTVGV